MKTKVLFLSSIVLYFTSCMQQEFNHDDSVIQNDKNLHVQEAAMQSGVYESFMDLMGVICSQTRSSIEKPVYPEYYGGTYVDDEGKLVVLITQDAATTRGANEAQAQLDKDNIIVQHCEHSYNQLKQIVDTITLHIEEKAVWTSNIGMYGINDINNRVSIYLFDDSELKRKELLNRLDNNLIEIGWCGAIEEHSPIPCGFALFGNSRGSVGYRAMDTEGKIGIVSAGHCFDVGERIFYSPDQTVGDAELIGKCEKSAHDDGYIDACFCVIDSPIYPPSNILPVRIWGTTSGQQPSGAINYQELSTSLAHPPIGLVINSIGSTSGWRHGRIIGGYTYCQTQHGFLRDVIYADYISKPGDSGGIVYALQSSSNTRLTVGINKGRLPITNANGTPDTVSICIKAYLINQRLGLTRY